MSVKQKSMSDLVLRVSVDNRVMKVIMVSECMHKVTRVIYAGVE